MYNTKNYTEQGGAVTHVGGKMIFEKGAEVEGGLVANQAASTATNATTLKGDFNDFLVKLKDAGIMKGDDWSLSFKTATGASLHNMPTAETLSNSQKVTSVDVSDNVINITLNCEVKDLDDADHGIGWGTHKWVGFGVCTGMSSVAGIVFDDGTSKVTLTAADDSEASDIGLSAGDFILYIKAENIVKDGGSFRLSGLGMDKTTFTMKITETTE